MHYLIPSAVAQLEVELSSLLPTAKDVGFSYLQSLGRGRPLADYFAVDWGYPLFSLPRLFEESITHAPDEAFRKELVYSTINGYLFIRLIDDVMDNSPKAQTSLLPLLAFFHHEFEKPYHNYFPRAHPFWTAFEHHWFNCHANAIVDRELCDIDHSTFCTVSAQKTCAAQIPLIALGCHYGREDLAKQFCRIARLFSCYVQLADDLFDWPEDRQNPRGTTYFLSEAKRRKHPGESLSEWALREGIDWAVKWCEKWLSELLAIAQTMKHANLESLIQRRREVLQQHVVRLRRQLELINPLASVLAQQE